MTVQEKSFEFAVSIIELYKLFLGKNEFVISRQLLKSSTSIGANIEEASAGQTKKDFLTKMAIASKEARETRYWLRLLDRTKLIDVSMKPYLNDVEELIRMLTKIVKTTSENLRK